LVKKQVSCCSFSIPHTHFKPIISSLFFRKMKTSGSLILLLLLFGCHKKSEKSLRIFDVHIHGTEDPASQTNMLEKAGVYKAAISSSWDLQEKYRDRQSLELLFGLMFPCPVGNVPYSSQPCFEDGSDWPEVDWVEEQIKAGMIDFLGELLNQYYGITPADSAVFPYYRLAEKYNLPVGIHTGGAGPDHGSPNFQWELGEPVLLKPLLEAFPSMRLWIMHSGDQHYPQTIQIMQEFPHVYSDISVIANPDIVDKARFQATMKALYDAGLEDRLMFASDNGDIGKMIAAIEELDFLTEAQKEKLFFKNAEEFFGEKK
jgi:hypothetical protein